MIECRGYEIFARALQLGRWNLSERALGATPFYLSPFLLPDTSVAALFQFCGLKKSGLTQTFSHGVVKNLDAFHHVILSWDIWCDSEPGLQELLFNSIADMLSANNALAFFNVRPLQF